MRRPSRWAALVAWWAEWGQVAGEAAIVVAVAAGWAGVIVAAIAVLASL